MHIYLKNITAKFNPNLIWNNGCLGLLWRASSQQEQAQEQEEKQDE